METKRVTMNLEKPRTKHVVTLRTNTNVQILYVVKETSGDVYLDGLVGLKMKSSEKMYSSR